MYEANSVGMERMYYRIGLQVDLANFIFKEISINRDKNIESLKKVGVNYLII